MSLYSLAAPKRTFSEMENRYLAELPGVSLRNVADGSFEEQFETYLNDHFAMRDFFVRLSAFKSYALGLREFGDVYYAKDDTLIRKLQVDQKREAYITSAIAKYAQNTEIPVCLALIPGAAGVWKDKLPEYAPNPEQQTEIQNIYEQLQESPVACVDLYSAMAEHRQESIYYHTDHHWTSLGAYYGFAGYMESLGEEFTPITHYEDKLLSDHFLGTLYSSAPFSWIVPDEIHAYVPEESISVTVYNGTSYQKGELYAEEHLKEKNQYTTFLGGNQPIVVVQNPDVQGERLLVVRDSYLDSMAPFLATAYSEVHLIDPRYYKQKLSSYAEEHGIDRILICMSLSSYLDSTGLPPILN